MADPAPVPFTSEHLLPEMLPHDSKWQSLGEALLLDDDQLDELFTNNEIDKARLEEMLELRMARSDLNQSQEEMQEALKKGSMTNQPRVSPVKDSVIDELQASLGGDSTYRNISL